MKFTIVSLKKKLIIIGGAVLFVIFVVLATVILLREFTTYSKDGFQISYPKDWVEDPTHYTAIADVNYREESGKEGLAKLPPTFVLLSVTSNKGEYQSLVVSKYGLETNEQEPIRTHLDKNLAIQEVIFPSIQEVDRRFFLNEEGFIVAQVVYTKDDPTGELGKLIITSRIIDGTDGVRWQLAYVTEETNLNKNKGISERIFDSFSLKKTIDWTMVGAISGIAGLVILWIIAPIIKSLLIRLRVHR